MRPISVVLITVALLGGGGATFMAKKVIEKRAEDSAARQEELKRDVEVLVASRDLMQGHLLKESDLRWERWPVVTAQATKVVTREAGKETLQHLPGEALRRTVVAGEPITASTVFKPGKFGIMTGLIAPGKRAIGIKVDAASTASGFVLPGDRVDVLVTVDLSRTAARSSGYSSGGARFVAEAILTDVRVLAVDQEMASGEGSAKSKTAKKKKEQKKKDKDKDKDEAEGPEDVAMVGKTVAVEVTPEQAQRLLAAQNSGKLSLVLRSLAAGTEEEPRGVPYITDVEASEAIRYAGGNGIRVIKGGQSAR